MKTTKWMEANRRLMRRISAGIIILLFFLLSSLLCSCAKADDPIPAPQDSTYTIRYFINCDSAFIRYNYRNDYRKEYLYNHFDTTFKACGGWEIDLNVTAFTWPMNAGVIVNGELIKSCSNVDNFSVKHYLK